LPPPFSLLLSLASGEVGRVLSDLPPDLRRRAAAVPVRYEERVAAHWIADGVEPDSLGLFSGPGLRDPDAALSDEPPLVTLFLRNLWDWCGGDRGAYLEEVARTYLHEFGHYLGLEEDGMEERDLD
jgi:predicted Zn-dependent protease with MMP-like domain